MTLASCPLVNMSASSLRSKTLARDMPLRARCYKPIFHILHFGVATLALFCPLPMQVHSILVDHNFRIRRYYYFVISLLTMDFSLKSLDRRRYGTVTFSSPPTQVHDSAKTLSYSASKRKYEFEQYLKDYAVAQT